MLAFHTPFDVNKSGPFRPLFKKTKGEQKDDLLDLLIVLKMYPKYNKGNENMTFPIPFDCLKRRYFM